MRWGTVEEKGRKVHSKHTLDWSALLQILAGLHRNNSLVFLVQLFHIWVQDAPICVCLRVLKNVFLHHAYISVRELWMGGEANYRAGPPYASTVIIFITGNIHTHAYKLKVL